MKTTLAGESIRRVPTQPPASTKVKIEIQTSQETSLDPPEHREGSGKVKTEENVLNSPEPEPEQHSNHFPVSEPFTYYPVGSPSSFNFTESDAFLSPRRGLLFSPISSHYTPGVRPSRLNSD